MLGSTSSAAMAALPALVRGLTTSSVAAAAVPAVASKSSGGLAAMLGFGSVRVDTPLSEPLPSATAPLKGTVPTVAPKLEKSSLDAGTKIAAIDTPSPVASLSLVFEAGTALESSAHLGASKVLEAMAFKATANRTTFRLTRELEKIGATGSVKAGRDYTAFTLTALRMHTPEAVEILLDAALNAKLSYWEVNEAVAAARAALAEAQKDPNSIIADVLHRAAFDGGLGQPVSLDPSLLDGFTNATLKEYVAAALQSSKAVLAGAGVGLDDFKELANPLVASSSGSGLKASSSYVGGSLNVFATSPLTHVALGFEAKGGLADPKAAAAAAVVKQLLDEGRAVLPFAHKESDVFKSAAAFSHMYKDTGIVGITATSAPAQAGALVDAVVKKVEAVAKGVPDAQLKVAKQLAVGAYKAQLASSAGLAGAMGPALLLTGKFDPADHVAKIESLTAADVTSFVSKALKSSPTYVTYGSMTSRVPRYEAVARKFA
mmetsp:Transcript_5267/g.12979  ORF Transcript_5267/g.12979 Transcript_5267/m.12979 type:complete len:489 (-) Transcript_5267:293-1759(-)